METQQQEWARAKEIFNDARELTPASRAAFVRARCGEDSALHNTVTGLLAADGAAGRFLAAPTLDGPDTTLRFAAADAFAELQQAVAGRYSIEREIGRGGMGIVFLARDVALDRAVAIKLLPPELSSVPEHRARFLREARTAAGFSHPHIVPIHLVEERGDLVFFVMAYVDGESLSQRVQRAGPLKSAEAARLVQEVAWALAYAHSRGVIHRDIKPDNVLIEKGSGRALVSDFGIAHVSSAGTLSRGEILGTLRYMSPEQAAGEQIIDGRSDLYSLGVTAFFALTARLPFESGGRALLGMYAASPAPPLRSIEPSVPVRLAEAIDRCLAKAPDARFANGEALADAIAEAQLTRRDIAPSVREFLSAARSGAVHGATLFMLWWSVGQALPRLMPSRELVGQPLDPVFAILIFVSIFAAYIPLHAARGVVRAGLDERDVADAVASGALSRDANVEYQLARLDRLARVLENPVSRLVFVGFLGTMGWFSFQVIRETLALAGGGGNADAAPIGLLPMMLASIAFFGALATVPRRVIELFTPGSASHASAFRRLWTGPVGRWLFKLAGIGLRRSARHEGAATSAPTEIVLGRAAAALFDQLPSAQRERLGDVHDVIRGLESAASSLRRRNDELLRVAADIGNAEGSPGRERAVADLERARAPLQERLQAAVSSLENLRVDLLRLRAGVGQADELTSAVEEARTVQRAIEVELSAQLEVESLGSRRLEV